MYWISYYLEKGERLDYLLNLSELEKEFYIESMMFNRELQVKYDEMKLKAMAGTS